MSILSKALKPIFKPLYNACISKLRSELQTYEQTRLMQHAIVQNDTILTDLNELKMQIRQLNLLIGGVNPRAYAPGFMLPPSRMLEIMVQLFAAKQSDVSAVHFFKDIDTTLLDNATVYLIGINNPLYIHELKKKNVKKITSIEMNPFIAKDIQNKDESNDTIYVYPTAFDTIHLTKTDVVIAPNPYVNDFLLYYNFFHLGAHITKFGIFRLHGNDESLPDKINHLAAAGFAETKILGKKTKSTFDYSLMLKKPEYTDSFEQQQTIIAHKLAS